MKTLFVATAFILGASSLAMAATPAPTKSISSNKGHILVDAHKSMSLYTFKKDTSGVSNCNGDCAVKWPPLFAAADAKPVGIYSIITRADGSKQWAKDGKALYFWFKDKKVGDTTGDGVKGVWSVARP